MPEVNNGYVELFRVLGQHGIIGIVLGVIAIFGFLCITALWIMKSIISDTKAFSDKVQELASTVSAIREHGEANDKIDSIQDSILTRHEDRLDNHEGRITVLENKED